MAAQNTTRVVLFFILFFYEKKQLVENTLQELIVGRAVKIKALKAIESPIQTLVDATLHCTVAQQFL